MRKSLLSVAATLMFWPFVSSSQSLAPTPPMGWNSWDSYGTTLTEPEYKANVDVMASSLRSFGYKYAVVDIEWYTPHPPSRGHYIPDPRNVTLDEFGRFVPAVNRFPSAANGKGFTALAAYAHTKGLKFGIHIMRGIPREAVDRNLSIEGTPIHAAEIANKADVCKWTGMVDTYGVDMTKPGAQAYYDSIVKLYASWGVDYIKADDMARPFHAAEIEALHAAIAKSGRPIVLSLSPGPAPLSEHDQLAKDAQLWRISGDFWDRWKDVDRAFDLLRTWSSYGGAGHWPDADMLPLGHIGLRGEVGEDRQTRLTHDEQRTLVNLWAIFRSPLIMGGDLPSLLAEPDHWTLSLLTNREVLAVDQRSQQNKNVLLNDSLAVWTALPERRPGWYVAVFNRREVSQEIALTWNDLGIPAGAHKVRDLWTQETMTRDGSLQVTLPAHASTLVWVAN